MRQKVHRAPERPALDGRCIHYWVVESTDLPVGKGVCKYCRTQKEFINAFPEVWAENHPVKARRPAEESAVGDEAGKNKQKVEIK